MTTATAAYQVNGRAQFEQWITRRFDAVDARNRVNDDPTMSLVVGSFCCELDDAEVTEWPVGRPMNRCVIDNVVVTCDLDLEFPRIDDRLVGMPAQYGVTVGTGKLVRYDLERGTAEEHSFGTASQPGGPGEAVFAPADSRAGELSGWYLSYVYDPVRDGSDLVIIDATNFKSKPVARVQLPRRVPYGFHGNWIAG